MTVQQHTELAAVVPAQPGPPDMEALSPAVATRVPPILFASVVGFVAGVLTSGAAFLLQG